MSNDRHLYEGEFIDPVCFIHGEKMSDHQCLYCCMCFKYLVPKECAVDDNGVTWDICKGCYRLEQEETARRERGV